MYQVVTRIDPVEFSRSVEAELELGWDFAGGVLIHIEGDLDQVTVYSQALTLREPQIALGKKAGSFRG